LLITLLKNKFTTEQARLYTQLLNKIGDDSRIEQLELALENSEDIYDNRIKDLELVVYYLEEDIKALKDKIKNYLKNKK